MVPQGGVGGMNGFELQAQAIHADIFLIFYSKHRFRVHVRAALLRYYQVFMIYSRENIRKRYTRHLLKFRAFTVTHIFTPAELYNHRRWLQKLEISDYAKIIPMCFLLHDLP